MVPISSTGSFSPLLKSAAQMPKNARCSKPTSWVVCCIHIDSRTCPAHALDNPQGRITPILVALRYQYDFTTGILLYDTTCITTTVLYVEKAAVRHSGGRLHLSGLCICVV